MRGRASLIYRGSVHGFAASEFHSRCDDKGATITIFKTTKGLVFGGYTLESWSQTGGMKRDPQAFLFSVDLQAIYPVTVAEKAIFCGEQDACGPTFGEDVRTCADMSTNANSMSNANYNHPKTASGTPLILGGEASFACAEVEVYVLTD